MKLQALLCLAHSEVFILHTFWNPPELDYIGDLSFVDGVRNMGPSEEMKDSGVRVDLCTRL